MSEHVDQIIRVDGRLVRLAMCNEFAMGPEVRSCPKVIIKPQAGFYVEDPTGFVAYDVTQLWRAKHP